jgi:hypothetical protein
MFILSLFILSRIINKILYKKRTCSSDDSLISEEITKPPMIFIQKSEDIDIIEDRFHILDL